MKQMAKTIPIIAFLLFLQSCAKDPDPCNGGITGSGPFVDQTRAFTGVRAVVSQLPADIVVLYDTATRLEITAQQEILDVLESKQTGGTLTLSFMQPVCSVSGILLTLYTPSLERFVLMGNGVADIRDIHMQWFEFSLQGNGSALLTGSARKCFFDILGNGDIHAYDFYCHQAKASILGNGIIRLTADSALTATIEGYGMIIYDGFPASVQASVSGIGSIIPRY